MTKIDPTAVRYDMPIVIEDVNEGYLDPSRDYLFDLLLMDSLTDKELPYEGLRYWIDDARRFGQ